MLRTVLKSFTRFFTKNRGFQRQSRCGVPQDAKSFSCKKRRRGGRTVRGTVLPGEPSPGVLRRAAQRCGILSAQKKNDIPQHPLRGVVFICLYLSRVVAYLSRPQKQKTLCAGRLQDKSCRNGCQIQKPDVEQIVFRAAVLAEQDEQSRTRARAKPRDDRAEAQRAL